MQTPESDTLSALVDALHELSDAVHGGADPATPPSGGRGQLAALGERTVDLARQLPPETASVGLVAEYYAWRLMRGMEPTPDFLRLQRLFERQAAAAEFPRLPLVITGLE